MRISATVVYTALQLEIVIVVQNAHGGLPASRVLVRRFTRLSDNVQCLCGQARLVNSTELGQL